MTQSEEFSLYITRQIGSALKSVNASASKMTFLLDGSIVSLPKSIISDNDQYTV